MHWYREGALDGHLGVFNLGRVLVVPHMMGCDDVARGAGRSDLDQLEKEDLGVDPCGTARSRSTCQPVVGSVTSRQLVFVVIALDQLGFERVLQCRHLELLC